MTEVHVICAEVLLKVDNHLSYHDRVLHVSFNPLQSFNALITSVLSLCITVTSSLADMDSSIHKVMSHHNVK